VTLLESRKTFQIPWEPVHRKASSSPSRPSELQEDAPYPATGGSVRVPLMQLCYARSGDKGDNCNIGVVARSQKIYPWMCQQLTARRVKDYFAGICQGKVERFEMPNLLALNFLLHESLGGGGTISLRIDPQGKTLAEALLLMEVEVPDHLTTDH